MPSMRPNRVKHKLAAGELATGIMGTGMTADLIEWLGPLGFDSVWLEGEHGPLDYRDIPDQSRAADLWGMTSIVRVNENRYGPIYRVLDLGAQGVCVPHVDTRDQAKAVADASKFFPVGKRGMTTSRQGYGASDFYERANDECLAIILIEDILAVNNLDGILEVEGVDIFYVAPGDLGQSLGHLDSTHPEVQAVIDQALGTIVASGRHAGTLVTSANVERYVDMGVGFVTTGLNAWIAEGAQDFLERANRG